MAALAATGVFAQSSVTLSGVVDVGVSNPIGADKARIDQSANGANQIVFSGSEDLGGGMTASFRLAQRFSPESGKNDGSANGRPTFQGESTVGVSGGFGAVKLGRAVTAFQGPVNNTDPWGTLQQGSVALLGYGYATSPGSAGSATGVENGGGNGRTDGIFYTSPSFNGITASVTYGFKNTQETGTVTTYSKNLTSAWVGYASGPLYIGAGAEENRYGDRATAMLATYDLGVAKLGVGYGITNPSNNANDYKNWNAMAIVPMGAVTLKVGYGQAKQEGSAAASQKLGVGVDYALSKRTTLYTSVGNDKKQATGPKSGFDLGIRHAF